MRMRFPRPAGLLFAAAGLVASTFPAQSDPVRSTTSYSVRFLGLSIARASFTTTVSGRDYTISGNLRSAGLAEIFDSTRGSATVRGSVQSDRLQARSYELAYTSGKKKSRTHMAFRNGNVVSASETPKPKKRGRNWIGVDAGDLRSVLDPISSLIVPAGTPVCPRRVPIFDGETRADLVLSPAGRQPFSTHGYKGQAIACSVRFVPKAGYRKGNDAIDYLKRADGIEVWFAHARDADVFAPVYAKVPTRIGSVTVWATRFGG